MNDFRERKQEARAKKVATRIMAERRAGIATQYPSLDAICAPVGGGQYVAPEPSKEMLAHMASFGFVLSPEDAAAQQQPPEPPPQSVSPVSPVSVSAVSETVAPPTLAEQIAAGIDAGLARLGITRRIVPIPHGDTPPRNEDK